MMADDSSTTSMADGRTWLSWAAAVIESADSSSSASSGSSASRETTSRTVSDESSSDSDSEVARVVAAAKSRAKTKTKAWTKVHDKENRHRQTQVHDKEIRHRQTHYASDSEVVDEDESDEYYYEQRQQALALGRVQACTMALAEKQDAAYEAVVNCEYAEAQEQKAIQRYKALKEALAQAMQMMEGATTLAREARDDVERAKYRALSAADEFDEALSVVKNVDALRSLGIS